MRSLLTRRRFLSQSAKATMAIAAPAIFPRGMLGAASPNERIVTGHIGLGGMGRGHLSFFRDMCGALCDVDANHMQRAAGRIGRYVPLYKDFRALLDQRDLDATWPGRSTMSNTLIQLLWAVGQVVPRRRPR